MSIVPLVLMLLLHESRVRHHASNMFLLELDSPQP